MHQVQVIEHDITRRRPVNENRSEVWLQLRIWSVFFPCWSQSELHWRTDQSLKWKKSEWLSGSFASDEKRKLLSADYLWYVRPIKSVKLRIPHQAACFNLYVQLVCGLLHLFSSVLFSLSLFSLCCLLSDYCFTLVLWVAKCYWPVSVVFLFWPTFFFLLLTPCWVYIKFWRLMFPALRLIS